MALFNCSVSLVVATEPKQTKGITKFPNKPFDHLSQRLAKQDMRLPGLSLRYNVPNMFYFMKMNNVFFQLN